MLTNVDDNNSDLVIIINILLDQRLNQGKDKKQSKFKKIKIFIIRNQIRKKYSKNSK